MGTPRSEVTADGRTNKSRAAEMKQSDQRAYPTLVFNRYMRFA